MTFPVFPTLPGIAFPVKRSPKASTLRQVAISGRTSFQPKWTLPLYDYEVSFSLLRAAPGSGELQALVDLWKTAMFTPGGVFLYDDPNDDTVTNQTIATGDGAATSFQLLRVLATFAEPVYAPVTVSLYKNDWQGNQLQYTTPRTNNLVYSQDFTNAAWTKASATATGAAGTAPDGTNTAVSLNDTSASVAGVVEQSITVADDGATYSVSAWVKQGTGAICLIGGQLVGGTAVTRGVALDPATGHWTAADHGFTLAAAPVVTSYPDGWWRVSFQIANNSSGNTSLIAFLYPAWAASLATPVNSVTTATPLATARTGTQLFWGAQVEARVAATSYIATTNAPATVTDYVLGAGGVVTFAAAPAAGAAISWSGTFNWLCRFCEDSLEFDNFMYQLFALKKCRFETVRP
jgi:Conserved hypothetical protein 2217 (DUF2460)